MKHDILFRQYIVLILVFFGLFLYYFDNMLNLLYNNTSVALKFNEELMYEKIFYEGVLDAIANLVGNKIVCRTTNIYRAVADAIFDMKRNGKSSAYIYLITDDRHIRAYYNGTFYEYTSQSHIFYKNNTKILKCVIIDNGIDYLTGCSIYYYHGKILGEMPEEILSILK